MIKRFVALVADDDKNNRQLMRMAIERARVQHASGGDVERIRAGEGCSGGAP
jgi:hypothetical protein